MAMAKIETNGGRARVCRGLRVMGVSDTHGTLDGLDGFLADCGGVDVVAIAGDVSPCWIGADAASYISDELFGWAKANPSVEFVLTPGNHDHVLDASGTGYARLMAVSPKNMHILVDQGWTHEGSGVRFWGTPWVPRINGRWAYESEDKEDERDLDERFAMIPHGIDVLVSHTPPRIKGERVDVSLQYRGGSRPFGSLALMSAIWRAKPRYCVCGHIHSGDHEAVVVRNDDGGTTMVYNCSRVDERYEIAYEPRVFEVGT